MDENKYRVGLVTGTFDLLHQGHAHLWQRAAAECEQLIIGVESDKRVRARKGAGRPLYNQDERKKRIESVFPGARVEILPENFGEEEVRAAYLAQKNIEALFVGEGEDEYMDNKRRLLAARGGHVVTVSGRPVISMTKILAGEQSPDYLLLVEDRRWLK